MKSDNVVSHVNENHTGAGGKPDLPGQREGIKDAGRQRPQMPATVTNLSGEHVDKKNFPRFLFLRWT